MLNKTKPFLYLISFCFSILILVYSSYIGIRNVFRYNVIKNELKIVQNDLVLLQNKNLELNETLTSLSDNRYWELLAKRKLGLKKTGEIMYMFVNNGENND